ncbi:hypothetical protein [Shewanella sp. UCD-KL12]|uniref:hypothetical protein n=1 Tax=Shewanella sp. UCD-KL12 TaxID=1917163 RepID=UPI0009706485|nr:hypothetical protein [Shewanella sp. UCD-KL12]
MLKNRKPLIVLGVLSVFMIVIIFLEMMGLDKEQSSVKQNIVGQWVSIDGLCSGEINEASIDGVDITSNYELMRKGHKAKINNMDISSVDVTEMACGDLGVISFDYEVSINTSKIEVFRYGKGDQGIEALAMDNGSLYFRYTPEFKNRFDRIREVIPSVAGF